MKNWKDIWENRHENTSESSILMRLIALDGFDTGHGTISEDAWLQYIDTIKEKLCIDSHTSIFEIGCGAGAFLYYFSENGNNIGGIDYSHSLINIANKYINSNDLSVCEAINLDCQKKYDVIISNSVFFYFPSLEYASNVLEKMLEKCKKSIAILEINDSSKKDIALSIRNQNCQKNYDGLNHLYYEKDWFISFAKKHNIVIKIEDQCISGYDNSSYRFNVFLSKP